MAQQRTPAQQARDMLDVLLAIAENAPHMANAKKRMYDAYVSEGFTEQQALDLVKTLGI